MTKCGLTYDRLNLDVRATIAVDISGYRFAVLTSTGSAVASLFAPIFSAIAINLLAILLLTHVLFANLIYCTQYFGNSKSRSKSYSGQALASFYFSVLGYDLSEINTSLGRLLAGIDTLLQEILMALYVGVVTVESISGSTSDFDPADMGAYKVAALPDSRVWDWVYDQGSSMISIPNGAADCLSALTAVEEAERADACCLSAGTLAELLKTDASDYLGAVDGLYNEGPTVMFINKGYADTIDKINQTLQWMRESGIIDDLYDKYLKIDSSGWGSLDVGVAIWASVGLAIVGGWLLVLIISKMNHTLRKRKVKAAAPVASAGNSPRLSV
ncbi:hypothetical protein KIPB_007573 [Kipferlia bialata]|uniref:Solute-binding protein family 3/N-terminal domain-containing protein n=1 Tax=Kipferlia bialata TaxID=797122 RepID=A0A9K3D0H2_9EUKA|nr:hypothetical protein KIPB_007573 [Kipferlia bialata]|eukprot:g7573.t1